jgi:hypothetical protein
MTDLTIADARAAFDAAVCSRKNAVRQMRGVEASLHATPSFRIEWGRQLAALEQAQVAVVGAVEREAACAGDLHEALNTHFDKHGVVPDPLLRRAVSA